MGWRNKSYKSYWDSERWTRESVIRRGIASGQLSHYQDFQEAFAKRRLHKKRLSSATPSMLHRTLTFNSIQSQHLDSSKFQWVHVEPAQSFPRYKPTSSNLLCSNTGVSLFNEDQNCTPEARCDQANALQNRNSLLPHPCHKGQIPFAFLLPVAAANRCFTNESTLTVMFHLINIMLFHFLVSKWII